MDAIPTISMFYGILIRMYNDEHNPPHLHAFFGEYQASYDFDGNVIDGDFPKRQHKLVAAWIEIHKDELNANWKLIEQGEPLFKIEPLR